MSPIDRARRRLIAGTILILTAGLSGMAAARSPSEPVDRPRRVLQLRSAVARGVAENLDLRMAELEVPIRRKGVTAEEAVFDPRAEASVGVRKRKIPTGSVMFEDDYEKVEVQGAGVGVRKRFRTGTRGRLSWETRRMETNAVADALDPEYKSILVLNLTQPLLRGFGYDVNTTAVRISKNRVRQAAYEYLGRIQETARQVETAYLSLARALLVTAFRVESRKLARELLSGNQERLDQGVISVTEVQEAKTALASRNEKVIAARQRAETLSNRLKDLLEIRSGHPLAEATLATEPIPEADRMAFPVRDLALAKALEERPELKALRAALDSQEIRLAFLRNRKLPQLDLGATLGLNGLSGDGRPVHLFGSSRTSGLPGDYGESLTRMAEGDGYEWAVDLKFSYPLGNRAAGARYERGLLEKRQLLHRFKRLEGGIETQVKNALVTVERSLERVRVSQRFEALARKTLNEEMARLRRGLSNTFRILEYQDDLISARIRRVTALIDFHKGLADLHRAMGTNLERLDIVPGIDQSLMAAGR